VFEVVALLDVVRIRMGFKRRTCVSDVGDITHVSRGCLGAVEVGAKDRDFVTLPLDKFFVCGFAIRTTMVFAAT
jgi:hypothetical protein